MSKTYKIRVPNESHEDLLALCAPINGMRPPGMPVWQPENFARFLILRGVELFQEDVTIVERFFAPLIVDTPYE